MSKESKLRRLRNEHIADVEVVTALITAINEAESRAFRILFNASLQKQSR